MSAAERKARLLAKASKQKPTNLITHNNIQAQQQQQQHAYDDTDGPAVVSHARVGSGGVAASASSSYPSSAAPSSSSLNTGVAPAAAAAVSHHPPPPAQSTAPLSSLPPSAAAVPFADDEDDGLDDATLYIDDDPDPMQLRRRGQFNGQQQQHATPHAHMYQQHTPVGHRGGASLLDVGEDDVASFHDDQTPSASPSGDHRAALPGGASDFSPSSTHAHGKQQQQRRPKPHTVAVLDSDAEERRLDDHRTASKDLSSARVGVATMQLNNAGYDTVASSAIAAPAAAAGSHAIPADSSAGWVEPGTRLQQVQVRAAPQRAHSAYDDDDGGANGRGGTDQSTQLAHEDAGTDQPYQRALQQQVQQHQQQQRHRRTHEQHEPHAHDPAHHRPSASGGAATSAAATTRTDEPDPQLAAYQTQLRLQAELAQLTQQRLERGELSADEQRAATMRLKVGAHACINMALWAAGVRVTVAHVCGS
jgi:hypothetical protein